MATSNNNDYPARVDIEYPRQLDKFTTFFRLIWAIPIMIILAMLSSSGYEYTAKASEYSTSTGWGVAGGLFAATGLMIVFRQRYPKWWFNFALEFERFSTRVSAYVLLLTDKYPSTEDQQTVHLDIQYPNVKKDLNRWLPIVKWFLAIPHYVVLFFLFFGVLIGTVIAWFAILFTGQYPRAIFDYVVGVLRWSLRVTAYAFLLVTDEYPPFSLD